jgi:hypothetical protein
MDRKGQRGEDGDGKGGFHGLLNTVSEASQQGLF